MNDLKLRLQLHKNEFDLNFLESTSVFASLNSSIVFVPSLFSYYKDFQDNQYYKITGALIYLWSIFLHPFNSHDDIPYQLVYFLIVLSQRMWRSFLPYWLTDLFYTDTNHQYYFGISNCFLHVFTYIHALMCVTLKYFFLFLILLSSVFNA